MGSLQLNAKGMLRTSLCRDDIFKFGGKFKNCYNDIVDKIFLTSYNLKVKK